MDEYNNYDPTALLGNTILGPDYTQTQAVDADYRTGQAQAREWRDTAADQRIYRCRGDQHFFECKHEQACECGAVVRKAAKVDACL